MTIADKFEEVRQRFYLNFIELGEPTAQGTLIPISSYANGNKTVGDGTINMANFMTYLHISGDNLVSIPDMLQALQRLVDKAYDYFNDKFSFLRLAKYNGFFVRDDIQLSNYSDWGSYKMLKTLNNEDPCHSPFVSQDQVWNLNPILMTIMQSTKYDAETKNNAATLGQNINGFIKFNGYKVYNPYISQILHFFKYLPSMNENKVAPWDRQDDRAEHYKHTVKVKRGANNWYYSGGTSACYDVFESKECDYKHTLRTFLYRSIVFFLDRIWEPLLQIFAKKDFKHNAYWCYGLTAGIWYGPNYISRFRKKFIEYLKDGKMFCPNLAPLVISELDDSELQVFKEFLESYDISDTSVNHLDYMLLYCTYMRLTNEDWTVNAG